MAHSLRHSNYVRHTLVTQLEEYLITNQAASGSSPDRGFYGAWLTGKQLPFKQRDAGSNPAAPN